MLKSILLPTTFLNPHPFSFSIQKQFPTIQRGTEPLPLFPTKLQVLTSAPVTLRCTLSSHQSSPVPNLDYGVIWRHPLSIQHLWPTPQTSVSWELQGNPSCLKLESATKPPVHWPPSPTPVFLRFHTCLNPTGTSASIPQTLFCSPFLAWAHTRIICAKGRSLLIPQKLALSSQMENMTQSSWFPLRRFMNGDQGTQAVSHTWPLAGYNKINGQTYI